jgi:hypothetical protein
MWTHTRMSFSSHIFTSLPLVHTSNPDFLGRQLWLCFLPVREFSVRDFQNRLLADSRISTLRSSWLRWFEIPAFRKFMTPRLRRFVIPESRMFATPKFRRPKIPENRMFATPRLHRSKIPENRMCLAPEKHISRTSLNWMFRGWRVFLNSPTLSAIIIAACCSCLRSHLRRHHAYTWRI